jgi:hypothetical protein
MVDPDVLETSGEEGDTWNLISDQSDSDTPALYSLPIIKYT